MGKMTFTFIHGCALSLVLLGVVGCAIDNGDPNGSGGEVVGDASSERFDTERAAAIAKAKIALVGAGAEAISPLFASCGTKGSTSISERVNDAAFTGAANQRSGSSTSCAALGVLQPTDDALYFCFTIVSDTSTETWSYNQNLRTGVRGWTRDDLLRPPPNTPFGGARNLCP